MTTTQNPVGQAMGRIEGPAKVTGQARYVADMAPEGTLIGKCLRSPLPHARIRRIDASAARALPGVHAVLTGFDIPDKLVGRAIHDIPVLARDMVRFIGEKVAAVAAETQEIAEEALLLIDVEYEELPAVFEIMEALEPDAPILHPNYNDYAGKPITQESPSNLASYRHWEKGDVSAGFAEADHVFEHTFTTARIHPGYMETHACLMQTEPDGRVRLWLSSKMPFQVRKQLAEGIDVPQEQIRVEPAPIGGDFGSKGSFMDTHICYHLARATGRPVRMVMDYMEEFQVANVRQPSIITYKTGVKNDGTITARQATMYFSTGAYGAFRPSPDLTFGSERAVGPYRVPHILVDSYMVYANLIPSGGMRAPGDPQTFFASESQMDIIARELGMDPYELRLRNLLKPGDPSPEGDYWRDIKGQEALHAACEAAGYWSPKPQGSLPVGRGMAIGERHTGGGVSRSQVLVDADGSITLRSIVPDTGSGALTILRQIVAQELGVAPADVRLTLWSTDDLEFDSGTGGSRATNVHGTATMDAAAEVRQKLVAMAADLYGWPEEGITLSGGKLSSSDGQSITLGELVSRAGGPIEADGNYRHTPHDSTCFMAQVAEVEVDPETGQVRLLRFTSAHDVGTVINPLILQGQIEGGAMFGIGFALMEDLQHDEGRLTAVSLGDYKIPSMADIPEFRTVLVGAQDGPGPYGSKGIGEHPIVTTAAAIANAVHDAIGVRITDLPITAEKVYRALHG